MDKVARKEKVKMINQCIQKSIELSDAIDLSDGRDESRMAIKPDVVKAVEMVKTAIQLTNEVDDPKIEKNTLTKAVTKINRAVEYVNKSAAQQQASLDKS